SCRRIIDSAKMPLAGSVEVFQADSRRMDISRKVDIVITSPPYVNRMSYIRELRPYMYWLKFINEAKEAGELDWKAIGGTWGTATSKLNNWSDERKLPIQEIKTITEKIAQGDSKNGRLLGNYVMKYFYDMWEHFLALHETVNNGGSIVYIIGNSSFYGNVVPAEKWYGELMAHAGFKEVQIETIRKRNSNKALYEFAVRAKRI
ncbi:MAG TPA: DNA methyltransferase, partial [Candidatus Paceibacterota bacterium]